MPFFCLKSDINEKISEEFFCFLFFFGSPHVPEDKWHSQKKWVFRLSLGGYPEMCVWTSKNVSSHPQNGPTFKNVPKPKMENFISPLRFKKSNYVIRLFSNKWSNLGSYVLTSRPPLPPKPPGHGELAMHCLSVFILRR